MAKAVLLLPRPEMLQQAENIAKNYHLDFLYMKALSSPETEAETDLALEAGAEIIIARGVQALIIKKRAQIPIVEILLTGQEMGLLIIKAKAMVKKRRPIIGVVGFSNMLCDMSSFNELYGVDLREFLAEYPDQLIISAKQARESGVDVLIGGDIVCQYAKDNNIPAVFQMSGIESIADAFRVAEKVSYAIDLEKKNSNELQTLLDYSFCGIIKINSSGIILRVNHFAEKLLKKPEQEIVGKGISELVPPIDRAILNLVLLDGQEVYSTAFTIQKTAVVSNIAPIFFEGRVEGAILSFNEGRRIVEMEAEIRRELYRKGYVARRTFETFVAQSAQTKAMVQQAKAYTKFNAPVLILGLDGTENEMMAQCIHNDSVNSNDSFVTLSCGTLPREELSDMIFGVKGNDGDSDRKGLVDWAKGGTLFIDGVSYLDDITQLRLYRLIRDGTYIRRNDIWSLSADVRIIASDMPSLATLVEQGKFRKELYYALGVLPLTIVPLCDRKDDIRGWLDSFISECEKKHKRYIRFTADAYKLLMEYDWISGLAELYCFCERLTILSPRRTVNEEIVSSIMNLSFTKNRETGRKESLPIEGIQEAHLRAALQKYHGKRQLVAKEMNISLTTLWRYMKKYQIYNDYK